MKLLPHLLLFFLLDGIVSQSNIKDIMISLSQTMINDVIMDSEMSDSQNVLYVATLYKGLIALNVSGVYDIINAKITQSFSFSFVDEYPKKIKYLGNSLIILSQNSITQNQFIQFFNISDEYFPIFMDKTKVALGGLKDWGNFSITDWLFCNEGNLIFGMEKNKGFQIIRINANFSLEQINKINLQNCIKFILSKDEQFIFSITNETIHFVNITDLTNLTLHEIDSSFLGTDSAYIIYGKFKLLKQLGLSPDGKLLHVLWCPVPVYWAGTFYSFDVSEMSNVRFVFNNTDSFMCDVDREEIFEILPDQQSALITNIDGILILFYPSLNYNTQLRVWVSDIHHLKSGYFVGLVNNLGKIILLKTVEMNFDDVPRAFTYMIQDLSQFPYWHARSSFNFAISDNVLFHMYAGIPELWDITDRVNPNWIQEVIPWHLTSSTNFDTTAYHDPNSPYFLVYTTAAEEDITNYYFLFCYNKTDFTQVSKTMIQTYDGSFNSMQITQIEDIAYLLPMNSLGKKDITKIICVNVTTGGYFNYTNIQLGELLLVASLASCGSYLFYIVSSDDSFLYVLQQDASDYTFLNPLSRLFINMSVYKMRTSADCQYLFLGGDRLMFVNIKDQYYPFVIKDISIFDIYDIQIMGNFIYAHTETTTKKIDISDILNPKFLLNQKFPYVYRPTLKIYETAIVNGTSGETYLYRSFYDYTTNDVHKKSPISLTMENSSSYYIFLLNDQTPAFVGITAIYKYYIISTSNFVQAKGVIKDVQLEKSEDDVTSETTPLPSWINFNFDSNEIYICPDKSYILKRLLLTFTVEGIFNTNPYHDEMWYDNANNIFTEFQQTIMFPQFFASLSSQISEDKRLGINTPSNDSINIIIAFNTSNLGCVFFQDAFSSVFLSFTDKNSKMSATASLTPLNEMLKNFRYSCNNNIPCENVNLSLQINDQINEEMTSFLSLCNVRKNLAPRLKSIDNTIQNQIKRTNLVTMPSLYFHFTITSDTFIDDDNDALTFTLETANGLPLPQWISFDIKNLLIYGNPSLKDEGLYSLVMVADDGYDQCNEYFNFTIIDEIPLINSSIGNQIAFVGKEFSFIFDSKTFIDLDGPQPLTYLSSVRNVTNDNFWLVFSSDNREFSGIPTLDTLNHTFEIMLIASDSLKSSFILFNLTVKQSLRFTDNSFPVIESFGDQSEITVSIKSLEANILLPSQTLTQYNVSCIFYDNMTKLQLSGKTMNFNEIFKYLLYRNNNNVIQQEETLLFQVSDQLKQFAESTFDLNYFENQSKRIQINPSVHQQRTIPLEIGNTFQMILDKNIFTIPESLMQITFSMKIFDSSDHENNFLEFNPQLFQFYSMKSIDASCFGRYRLELTATDEFLDNCTLPITLTVDYSTIDKVLNVLKWMAAVGGPLMSILAGVKYYYFLYNFLQRKSQTREIRIGKKFKWKFPLIGEEYNISYQIANKALEHIKKSNKKLIENFIKDNYESPKGLSEYPEFLAIFDSIELYKTHSERNIATINCIIEGIIHSSIINTLPFTNKILSTFRTFTSAAIKKNSKKKIYVYWYDYFFQEKECKEVKNENLVPISKFGLQDGKFLICEKNVRVNLSLFMQIFGKVVKKLSHSRGKIAEEAELNKYKFLVLHCVVLCRRGLAAHTFSFFIYLNQLVSKIGIKILPFQMGDSLLCKCDEIDNVFCQLRYQNKITQRKFKKKQEFFSFNSKTVPSWLSISQKLGILIIKGEAPSFENGQEYDLKIKDPRKLHILEYTLEINSGTKSVQSMGHRLTTLKSVKSLKNEDEKKLKTTEKLKEEKNLSEEQIPDEPEIMPSRLKMMTTQD